MSEAKKKALYASHVFGGSGDSPAPPPANELSELKLREVTGSDIFNNEAADEVCSHGTLAHLEGEAMHPALPVVSLMHRVLASWHNAGAQAVGARGGQEGARRRQQREPARPGHAQAVHALQRGRPAPRRQEQLPVRLVT